MSPRTPLLRRPVRVAAIFASVVALVGSGAGLIPGIAVPTALAFAPIYGAFLGFYVIGLVLACQFRLFRWWLGSMVLPLMCAAVIAVGVERWPEAFMDWWPVVGGVSLAIIVSWLLAGCLLAVLGWRSYAQQYRSVANAAWFGFLRSSRRIEDS